MEAEQLIARVQELTGRLEDLEDAGCRELAEELTGAVVQMYGAGLERIVELIEDEETRDRLAADELVAGLLMIHDLYPGADRGAGDGRRSTPCGRTWSRTAATSSCSGSRTAWRSCASRGAASRAGRRPRRSSWRCGRRSQEAAPDLLGMDVEGVVEEEADRHRRRPAAGRQRSARAGTRLEIERARARSTATDVDGMSLVVANVDGTLLAYRERCASCGGDAGRRGARRRRARRVRPAAAAYFLPQAGRSMDDDHLQLEPVPLLREAEEIKVAL